MVRGGNREGSGKEEDRREGGREEAWPRPRSCAAGGWEGRRVSLLCPDPDGAQRRASP